MELERLPWLGEENKKNPKPCLSFLTFAMQVLVEESYCP